MKLSMRNLILVGIAVILIGVVAAAMIQLRQEPVTIEPVAEDIHNDPNYGPNMPPTDVSDAEIPVVVDTEYEQNVTPVDKAGLPQQVVGISLAEVIEGPAAMGAISKLHGTEITVSDGLIAKYGEKGNGLEIWFSTSASVQEASTLLQSMIEKMKTNEVFSTPIPMPIRKRVYYQTVGNDLMHFFYQRGRQVVWLTLDVPQENLMAAMKDVVGI